MSTPPPGSGRSGERRRMTIVFSDLVGSTALAMELDPEDMHHVLEAYQEVCAEAFTSHGGHVAEFLGDGVVAYFGYPRATELDALRAVRASLELTAAVAELRPVPGVATQARVGMHTGLAVVGAAGVHDRPDAVVGPAPNIAARAQAAADPGGVVMTADTFRLVEDQVEARSLGEWELKGVPGRTALWQVVRVVDAPGSLPSGGDHRHPLVGREEEFEYLRLAWNRLPDDGGTAVVMEGEPGIGKSRLVRAVCDHVRSRDGWVLAARCSHYHRDTPFHPVLQTLNRIGGGTDAEKIERLLARMGAESHDRKIVGDLLTGSTAQADDEQRRQLVMAALSRVLMARAARRPGLLILEDAHWADPSTIELVATIIEQSQEAPILFVGTSRDSAAPEWTRAGIERLRLGPLPRPAVLELIARTAGNEMSDTMMQRFADRADGIPLFAEELTRAYLERGEPAPAGEAEPDVPATLHDTLMARLDRLAHPAREAAQLAAVVGREFTLDLVEGLGSTEAREGIAGLREAGIVEPAGPAGSEVYAFRHALVRDTAYGSMLRSRRRELHGRTAELMEARATVPARAEPEVIARHYTAAGRKQASADHWFEAGLQALRRHASLEATRHLAKAIEATDESSDLEYRARVAKVQALDLLARREEQRQQLRRLVELAQGTAQRVLEVAQLRARLHWSTGALDDAEAAAASARDLAASLGHDEAEVACMALIARVRRAKGDLDGADELAQLVLARYQSSGDTIGQATIVDLRGGIAWERGDHRTAALLHAKAAELFETSGDLPRRAQALNNLGTALWGTGDYLSAAETHEKSVTIARRIGDRRGEGDNLDNLGGVAWVLGDYQTARLRYGEALDIRRASDDPWGVALSLLNLGRTHLETDDVAEAERCFREALEVNADVGAKRNEAGALCGLIMTLTRGGQTSEAAHLVERTLVLHRELDWREGLIETLLAAAELAMVDGDPAAAKIHVQAAHELLTEDDRPSLRQAVHLSSYDVLTREDQSEAAYAHLRSAGAAMEEAAAELPSDVAERFLESVPLNQRTRTELRSRHDVHE